MTGVVIKSDGTRTGVKIGLDTGTTPAIPVGSTCTIGYYGSISTTDDRSNPECNASSDERKKEKFEQERVKKMREGWKTIRKGHENRK